MIFLLSDVGVGVDEAERIQPTESFFDKFVGAESVFCEQAHQKPRLMIVETSIDNKEDWKWVSLFFCFHFFSTIIFNI